MIDKARYRLNAKQTAKNRWQIDATIENSDYIMKIVNQDDTADIIHDTMGLRLLSIIKEAERAFKADGRKMVGE